MEVDSMTIKEELHTYIDKLNEDETKALYMFFTKYIRPQLVLTEEDKIAFDQLHECLANNETTSFEDVCKHLNVEL